MSRLNPVTFLGLDTGRLGLWNPANLLTFSRLLLGIAALLLFELQVISPTTTLVMIFIAASTDFDGFLARRLNCTSDFGRFFDPVADKLFLAIVGTWAILNVGIVAPLVAILIFIQFLISLHTLKTKTADQYNATPFGKKSMAMTLSGLVLALFMHNVVGLESASRWQIFTTVWLLVAIYLAAENYRRIVHNR